MKHNYSKKPFSENMIKNRINKTKAANKKLALIFFLLFLVALVVAFIYGFDKTPEIIYSFIFAFLFLGFIISFSMLIDKEDGKAIKENNSIRVVCGFSDPNKHYAKFLEECKAGKFYVPEVGKDVMNCNFFATDTYLAYFKGYMIIIPVDNLMYVYADADAYRVKHGVNLEIVFVLYIGTKIKSYTNEKVIRDIEKFLLNRYGIMVGFKFNYKKISGTDFLDFSRKCKNFKEHTCKKIEQGRFSDKDYPYSFATKSSNPRRYAGGYTLLIYGLVILFMAIASLVSDGTFSLPMLICILIGFVFLVVSLVKIFDL